MDENQVNQPNQSTKIQDTDRAILEVAKNNKRLALANAEKAIAQHETADINYKYVVLQLYMKYGLTAEDSIDENGNIIKGGAST
jgi:hypothetical protein